MRLEILVINRPDFVRRVSGKAAVNYFRKKCKDKIAYHKARVETMSSFQKDMLVRRGDSESPHNCQRALKGHSPIRAMKTEDARDLVIPYAV
jgi:hypothetical protein